MMNNKQYVDFVEEVMGKPFKIAPLTFSWNPTNVYSFCHEMFSDVKGSTKQDVETLCKQKLASKAPFSYKNELLLCTEEAPEELQTVVNTHEFTHAYQYGHWPELNEEVSRMLAQYGTKKMAELTVLKILEEGIAEFVCTQQENFVVQSRKKMFFLEYARAGSDLKKITQAVIKRVKKGELIIQTVPGIDHFLGYGLIKTAANNTHDVWGAFNQLVHEQPSLEEIGQLIDPAVYEVKG